MHIAKTNHLGDGCFCGDLICSRRMSQVQNQTYPMNSNDPIHLVLSTVSRPFAQSEWPSQGSQPKKFDNRQFFGFRGDLHPFQAPPPKKSPLIFFRCGKISSFFVPFTEVKVPGLQLPSAVARGLVHLATHL